MNETITDSPQTQAEKSTKMAVLGTAVLGLALFGGFTALKNAVNLVKEIKS